MNSVNCDTSSCSQKPVMELSKEVGMLRQLADYAAKREVMDNLGCSQTDYESSEIRRILNKLGYTV